LSNWNHLAVFYVQGGWAWTRSFPMLKFRSMRQDAEQNGAAGRPNDPRRTRLGALMRSLNVDELRFIQCPHQR
jgi:lipopolysaccharide/colanic/teichoic acid biosynthesis glycosyltransferase